MKFLILVFLSFLEIGFMLSEDSNGSGKEGDDGDKREQNIVQSASQSGRGEEGAVYQSKKSHRASKAHHIFRALDSRKSDESTQKEGRNSKQGDNTMVKAMEDISLQCTIDCTSYWKCRAEHLFIFGECEYPSGCECNCFAWQDC